MRGGAIYLVTNTVNEKQYVGQTVDSIGNRWAKHVYSALKGNRKHAISCAIRKYGPKAFTVEVIARLCDQAGLNSAEEAFITALGTLAPKGYNLASGGDCAPMPESSRRKIAVAVRQQWENPAHRERIRAASRRMWQNPEHRKRITLTHTGRRHTPEEIEKMRAAKTGKPSALKGRSLSSAHRAALKAAWARRKAQQCQTPQT